MTVTIIGLGYIGLPTAALIADKNIQVNGFDINPEIVDSINQGKIHLLEPGLKELINSTLKSGHFKASTDITPADVYLIVVPTPFKQNRQPDISFVEAATRSVIPLLKKDDLFVIESTSPVLTTEKMGETIFHERPELRNKVHIAYCPERVLPGKALKEMVENDRVIGGITPEATQKAIQFYSLFVNGTLHPSNSRTAEMCKLVENASRDVEIAFANELSIICDKAGINVWELIDLANKHPRVNILQPGCGVGGHCIAVDPWFLVADYPEQAHVIKQAREINDYKAEWSTQKILNAALQFEINNDRPPIIACMGLAFKPDIDDLRESPAKHIASGVIAKARGEILVVEPNINNHASFTLTNYQEAYQKADIVAWLVRHKEFLSIQQNHSKIEIDLCGIRK